MLGKGVTEHFAHTNGLCHAVFHPSGKRIVTCGHDGEIRMYQWPSMKEEKKVSRPDSQHAIAISKKGDRMVAGGEDNTVALFSYPGAAFQSNLTRFGSKINHAVFNPSGLTVACCSDENDIKLVNLIDTSQISVLKGHSAPVRSLAYDPLDDFLASADSTGVLRIWRTEDLKISKTMKICPESAIEEDTEQMIRMAWHPDGRVLAVPSKKNNEIVFLGRGTWETEETFSGIHKSPVSVLAWSQNGLYLASADQDGKVYVWDMAKKDTIGAFTVKSRAHCTALCWSPTDNSLAVLSDMGYLTKWMKPVPSHMPSPFDRPAAASTSTSVTAKNARANGSTNNTAKLAPATSADMESSEDEEANSDAEEEGSGGKKRKRLKKIGDKKKEADMLAVLNDDYDDQYEEDYHAAPSYEPVHHAQSAEVSLHPVIQSGSTPAKKNARRFLAWNDIGYIRSQEEQTFDSVEIEFSDTTKHRAVRFKDRYHFQMAALGEHGAVFASKIEIDEQEKAAPVRPSTLFYRSFDGWAPNTHWTVALPAQVEAHCVAIGRFFAAVATSTQDIRIMSHSGVERFVFSCDGPVVTMAGTGSLLAIVYNKGNPFPGGVYNLGFLLLEIDESSSSNVLRTVHERSLPLTPGSTLQWLSFASNEMPLAMDSRGVMRGLASHWGNRWAVVFDQAKVAKAGPRDVYWPVALIEQSLMCAVCKGKDYPSSNNIPVLTPLPLRIPLLRTDQSEALSQKVLLSSLMLRQGGAKPSLKEIAGRDKCLIQLIQMSAKSEPARLVKALDLSTSLQLQKSLQIAITLANHNKMPNLAERMNVILMSRIQQKKAAARVSPSQRGSPVQRGSPLQRGSPSQARASPPPSSSFSRKRPMTPSSEGDSSELENTPSKQPRATPPPASSAEKEDSATKRHKLEGRRRLSKMSSPLSKNSNRPAGNPFAKKKPASKPINPFSL